MGKGRANEVEYGGRTISISEKVPISAIPGWDEWVRGIVREEEAARRAPLLLSQAEAASSIGVSKRWLEQAIARGELPTVRLGRRRLVAFADLEVFVAERREFRSDG